MAIVVLMNNSLDPSPTAIADELAGQLLPGNRAAPQPFPGDAEALLGTYEGTTRAGSTTIQVARGTERLTISIDGAAEQPLPWVEGLTFGKRGRDGGPAIFRIEMRTRASQLLKETTRGRSGRPGMATPLAVFVALAASAGSGLSAQQDTTPHSEARLVSDVVSVRPGEPFTVGFHVTLDEGWRTPWKNAGDAGNGLLATWSLPSGFAADSFAYPIPERIPDPPVASYGYNDEVVFLATITPPADLEASVSVRLRLSADFLVCGDTCIPAHAERSLELPVRNAPPPTSGDAALIRRYADGVPVEHAQWTTRAARTDSGFVIGVAPPADWEGSLGGAYFFPADPVLLDHAADQPVGRTAAGEYRIRLIQSAYLPGEPERIEGILVLPDGGAFDAAGHRGLVVSTAVADAEAAWAAEPTEPVAVAGLAAGQGSAAGAAGGVTLLLAGLFALVGGVILTPAIVLNILNH